MVCKIHEFLSKRQIFDKDPRVSHTSFKGGKYIIKQDEYNEFLELYFKAIKSGEKMYLSERISYCPEFNFFVDIDIPENEAEEDWRSFINTIVVCLQDIDINLRNPIVSKRLDTKFHLNYNYITSSDNACNILEELSNKLKLTFPDKTWSKILDTSVYHSGLRVLGSNKKDEKTGFYQVVNLLTGELESLTLKHLFDTKIRVTDEITSQSSRNNKKNKSLVNAKWKSEFIIDDVLKKEIENLLSEIKNINFLDEETEECSLIRGIDTNINNIQIQKHKENFLKINQIKIEPVNKTCIFKGAEHKRHSNPVNYILTPTHFYIKCYDENCKDLQYPIGRCCYLFDKDKYTRLYDIFSSNILPTDIINLSENICNNPTHYDIANLFMKKYGERFAVNIEGSSKMWFEYDKVKSRWQKSTHHHIYLSEKIPRILYQGLYDVFLKKIIFSGKKRSREFILQKYKKNYELFLSVYTKLKSHSFKSSVINETCDLLFNKDPNFMSKLNEKQDLIQFENGVYDLNTLEFRKGRSDDFLTFTTKLDYIPYENFPAEIREELSNFISTLFVNENIREYVLFSLSQSLDGYPNEKFYFWTGYGGANGKSSLTKLCQVSFGDYFGTLPTTFLTQKRATSSNASPDIIALKGKRFVSFQEPDSDDAINTGIMKLITGSDIISGRQLYQGQVEFQPHCKLYMCCNELLDLKDNSGGTWRRVRVVNFESRFVDNPDINNKFEFKKDPRLNSKLILWKEVFVSLLIEYYKKYKSNGNVIFEPQEVLSATNEYQKNNNIVKSFLYDYFEEDPDQFYSLQDLFDKYQEFIQDQNIRQKMSKIKFSKEIQFILRLKKPIKRKGIVGFPLCVKNSDE